MLLPPSVGFCCLSYHKYRKCKAGENACAYQVYFFAVARKQAFLQKAYFNLFDMMIEKTGIMRKAGKIDGYAGYVANGYGHIPQQAQLEQLHQELQGFRKECDAIWRLIRQSISLQKVMEPCGTASNM